MFKKILAVGCLVLSFCITSNLQAKVVDVGLNLRYGGVGGGKVKCSGYKMSNHHGGHNCQDEGNKAGFGTTIVVDVSIFSGLYLGVNYSFDLLYGNKVKEANKVHQLTPTLGWNFPTIADLFHIFTEVGLTVWDHVSVDSDRFPAFDDADLTSFMIAGGVNIHMSDWFSLVVKQSAYMYSIDYKYDGEKVEDVDEFYITIELGTMFSF